MYRFNPVNPYKAFWLPHPASFSPRQTRFEAAMPQLMQLLAELLRGGAAAGTGDTGNAEAGHQLGVCGVGFF